MGTWNLWWRFGDWRARRPVVEQILREERPDILGLQEVDSPHGSIPFCCAHLNSGWAQSSIRTDQLASAAQLLADNLTGEFPPILCGDFNADDDFDEIRALSGKTDPLIDGLPLLDLWWVLRPAEAGWTWDRRNPHVAAVGEPSARIDYLFAGYPHPDGAGRPVSIHLIGDAPVAQVWPSDHFGLIAELAPCDPEPAERKPSR